MDRRKLIDTAQGKLEPDLVLKNGRIIQVLTGEILEGDIAVKDGWIAGVGRYDGPHAADLDGRYVSPGFINAHCHVESSMALPEVYCAEELRYGVTTLITDPHEIANVAGAAGIAFMLDRSEGLPMRYYVQAPSCVPCTALEHAGSVLTAESLAPFLAHPRVTGLGEMMDFHGVADGAPGVLEKLDLFSGKVLDGHLPAAQPLLQPYAAAGIRTDHESVAFEEARAKLRAGLSVLIRQGSGSKNLDAIAAGIVREGLDTSGLAFCTDDKHLLDIHREGTIRCCIECAIALGLPPVTAYRLATLNAARIYRLWDLGAIAPGFRADLVVLDSLEQARVHSVYQNGKNVSGLPAHPHRQPIPPEILHSVHIRPLAKEAFRLPGQETYPVINMVPNQIITRKTLVSAAEAERLLREKELLKIAVVERHHATGCMGVGLLARYGLRDGAIATTVAHDSHNLIVVGGSDRDMHIAVQELQRVQGGFTLVRGGQVLATLPLPVAGLMSDKPCAEITAKLQALTGLAREMGVDPSMDPFIALSFLALPVLPEIRITDLGVVEVA